jgi:hypothetical protein
MELMFVGFVVLLPLVGSLISNFGGHAATI